MRITDLLDKRSISLDAAPVDKKATLDMAVELMAKSRIKLKRRTGRKYRNMNNPFTGRRTI